MRTPLLIRTALILVLSIVGSALSAQDIDEIKTWSVEEFARRMTDQMTPRVPLDSGQVEVVHKINLKFAGQVKAVAEGAWDQKSKLSAVKRLDRQRSTELEVFLNPEQMRQVRQIQGENRQKMKENYHKKHL